MSNNGDQSAKLRFRNDGDVNYTVNLDYATVGEVELVTDLLHWRGAGFALQTALLYAQPEFQASGALPGNNYSFHIGVTQLEMARASLVFTLNGTEPYTMFELPYHSNHEAVIGFCGMIARMEKTKLTPAAHDSLGVISITGAYCKTLGITFGWNWRIGDSGWVFGLNGQIMFIVNKNYLASIDTEEKSPFESGELDFAPRIITAGLGYHF